jgi:uncharacterized protein YjbJ (UPF0337 family)
MSEQNNNNSTQINNESSTLTALKDQLMGATKEVFGAVFNDNLHDAGAEQRIRGEREFEELRHKTSSPESNVSAPWSASETLNSNSTPAEPSKTWFGSWFGSAEPSAPVIQPTDSSNLSALKDQYVGATKEVVGAVFNEDLQNAGAEQRIRGELNQAPPSSESSSWTAPWSATNENQNQNQLTQNWTDPAEPSKISAVKDQLLGATKEVLGAVFSENLHTAGIEQRIHGEREYEIAVMTQERQADQNQTVGAVKEVAGQVMNDKRMEAEGFAQQRESEIKRVLNA